MGLGGKIWAKFINSRETKPVALTEQLKSYKLVYREDGQNVTKVNVVITSIEEDIILALHFIDYSPKKKKAALIILDDKEKEKGILYVDHRETILLNGKEIHLCKVTSAKSYPPRLFPILMNHLVYGAKRKLKYQPAEGKRLHNLFVYYIKPRPAFLLSVMDSQGFDVFPVDLNGNIFDDYFIQSVKSTNQGIAVIQRAKTFCLSAIPFNQADLIYKYHEQRKKERITLKNVPFPFSESRLLKIPVPDFALNVREYRVERSFENGLYTTFLLKCVNHYELSNAAQFAHTPWYCLKNNSGSST